MFIKIILIKEGFIKCFDIVPVVVFNYHFGRWDNIFPFFQWAYSPLFNRYYLFDNGFAKARRFAIC